MSILWEDVRSLENDLSEARNDCREYRKKIQAQDSCIATMQYEHNRRIAQIAHLEKHIDILEEELAEAATRTRV